MARKGQARVLSEAELKNMWAELEQPHRIITQICYYTASRINEVVALKAEDMTRDRISLRVSKRKSEITKHVTISKSLRNYLDDAKLPTKGHLFPAAKWVRAERTVYRIDRQAEPKPGNKFHFDKECDL